MNNETNTPEPRDGDTLIDENETQWYVTKTDLNNKELYAYNTTIAATTQPGDEIIHPNIYPSWKAGKLHIHHRPIIRIHGTSEQRQEDLLAKARAHYTERQTPAGNEAAAAWLREKRSIITEPLTGRIYAYNEAKGHYTSAGDALLKADLAVAFGPQMNRARVAEILAKASALSYRDPEDLTRTTPPHLIPVKNGIYDLQEKKLLQHSPKYFFTYTHPIHYDPEATCPNIQKFLQDVVREEKEQEILLDMTSLAFYRERVTRNFYILVGQGHNGKTVLTLIIKTALGKKRCVSITPQGLATDTFAPAQLYDRHVNLGADIPGGYLKDTSIVKSATGGDSVSVQRKGVDREERELYCEFIWASNDPPKIPEDTHAIWDRLVVITFPFTFVEHSREEHEKPANKDIEEEVTTPRELSGLFNLVVERLPRLVEQRRLSVELDPLQTRREYRALSDTPAVFVEEMCQETEYDPGDPHTPSSGYVLATTVYSIYKEWCKQNRATPVSAIAFGKAVVDKLGFERGRDEQARSYRGLILKQTESNESNVFPYSTRIQKPIENTKVKTLLSLHSFQPEKADPKKPTTTTIQDLTAYLKQQEKTIPIDELYARYGEPLTTACLAYHKERGELIETKPGFIKWLA